MAIEAKDLTEEQKKKIAKLFKKYMADWFLAMFFYSGFAFFANLVIVWADIVYFHDAGLRIFMAIGTGIIAYTGLLGTMREKREIFDTKIKAIVGENDSSTL